MMYLFNPISGIFWTSFIGGRAQITIHEIESGKRVRFIITHRNKNYHKFINARDAFVFSGNIVNAWTPCLKSFIKFERSCYPEYYV